MMKQNDVLVQGFEDIKTLYQYLYMDENNCIIIDNELTKLEIKMDKYCNFKMRDMSYPDLPPMEYNDMMTIEHMLSIIAQLKEVSPVIYPKTFESRWDEIKTIKSMTITLNECN